MKRKYIKITGLLFILCLMMSVYSVNAGTQGFLSIELPGLKVNYNGPEKYKDTTTNQKYSSNGTNLSDGTLVDVQVNVDKIGVTAAWKTLSKNESYTWSTIDYTTYGFYKMQFQQKDYRVLPAFHSGVWSY